MAITATRVRPDEAATTLRSSTQSSSRGVRVFTEDRFPAPSPRKHERREPLHSPCRWRRRHLRRGGRVLVDRAPADEDLGERPSCGRAWRWLRSNGRCVLPSSPCAFPLCLRRGGLLSLRAWRSVICFVLAALGEGWKGGRMTRRGLAPRLVLLPLGLALYAFPLMWNTGYTAFS
jgi:hypothetical protein